MTLARPPSPFALAAERYAETAARRTTWADMARPEQLSPPHRVTIAGQLVLWFIWLILAGRGFGKTKTGAEWAAEMGRRYPAARIALVAATFADARDTMVEGDAGLLSCLTDDELRGGSVDKAWNRSLGELYLANGTRYKCYSSEKPRKLRGPSNHFGWGDEVAQWTDAKLGVAQDTTWSNLVINVRLPARPEWDATEFATRIVVTTTPKRVPLLKVPPDVLRAEPHRAGLLQQERVVITRGRTDDNLANLSETYLENVVEPLRGTRLGRQELDAEYLEDVEGAFWSSEDLEADRVRPGDMPPLVSIITAVDPATTNKPTSAETGIVTVARGLDDHGYALGDVSGRYSPLDWGVAVWLAALEHGSEAIVVEDNAGGDLVESNLAAAWALVANKYAQAGRLPPPVRRIHAQKNKRARAASVAVMSERHVMHHVYGAPLSLLEDQLTGWDGEGDSPDRLDAYVHGLRWLFLPQTRQDKGAGVTAGERWGAIRTVR